MRILKRENIQEICCIKIPEEINYAEYMLIGTCLSDRHLNSSFVNINRQYKALRNENDKFMQRTKLGKESKWCAIDMGHIVVHLFLAEAREYYDLEGLWTCGSEFDEKLAEFRKEKEEMEKRLTFVEENEKLKKN